MTATFDPAQHRRFETRWFGDFMIGERFVLPSRTMTDALFAAFNDGGREIETDDLLRAAKDVVPLAKTAAEKISRLREYWTGRARPATAAVIISDLIEVQ